MTTDECNCGNARGHMAHDPACPAAPPPEALRYARAQALEEAAKIAEECSFREAEWPEFFYDEMVQCGLSEARRIIAAAIRASVG